jgi:hypothetical protein
MKILIYENKDSTRRETDFKGRIWKAFIEKNDNLAFDYYSSE